MMRAGRREAARFSLPGARERPPVHCQALADASIAVTDFAVRLRARARRASRLLRADGPPGDRRQAHVLRRLGASWAPGMAAPAQRHPVRMGRLKVLVRVDLPVDVVVVLEQKERAGQTQGTECALCKRGCPR